MPDKIKKILPALTLKMVNVLQEAQSIGGKELRQFFGWTLMPSVLDRAFKGEL